jgi:predicted ATP-grasp superfamily ATP-dependent carboligase
MGNKINVLVFPCGAESAMEIHQALKDVFNIQLFGASSKEDHGSFIFKNYAGNVPYISENAFLEYLNTVISQWEIHVIMPAHDDISLYLAQNEKHIRAKIAVPGLRQAQICRSKKATYQLLKGEMFCPEVFDTVKTITHFPVYAKPDFGQGGKGAFIIEDKDDPRLKETFLGESVVTEFLPGQELTVDCFSDRHGSLRFVGPRTRSRVFGGISVNSHTVPLTTEIESIAGTIHRKVGMRGLWYFQVKQDVHGRFKLLEISARTASCMNLYRGLGVNLPLLTVYDLMDHDVEILQNGYYLEVDRALCNRYKTTLQFDTVYIDFDDTITKNGNANPCVMFFLYHAKNTGKKLKLITKHESDLRASLSRLSIDPSLFDEIIFLKPTDEKHEKITETDKVIFIDNAYKERAQVSQRLHIPVFDVDAISTLIDWRE